MCGGGRRRNKGRGEDRKREGKEGTSRAGALSGKVLGEKRYRVYGRNEGRVGVGVGVGVVRETKGGERIGRQGFDFQGEKFDNNSGRKPCLLFTLFNFSPSTISRPRAVELGVSCFLLYGDMKVGHQRPDSKCFGSNATRHAR